MTLEGLMLKLKLQYSVHLMQRADSLKKTLMLGLKAGGEDDDRGWDGWMASPLMDSECEHPSGVSGGQGGLACCSPWGRKESDTTEQLNWTERLTFGIEFWRNYSRVRCSPSFFIFTIFWLCWVSVAGHGLSVVGVSEGYSLFAVCGLLIAVASPVMDQEL